MCHRGESCLPGSQLPSGSTHVWTQSSPLLALCAIQSMFLLAGQCCGLWVPVPIRHHGCLEETGPFVVSSWQSKGRFKSTRPRNTGPVCFLYTKSPSPLKKFFKFVLQEETNLYETLCMAVNLIDQMFVRFNTRCLKSCSLHLGPALFWGGRSRFIGNNEISFYTLQVL